MSERNRGIMIALIPMVLIGFIMLAIPALGKFLPGYPGEVFAKIGGIMWSPFGLEASLFFLGIIAVFTINNIRRKREGDEYVSLEIPDSPNDSKP